MALSLLLYHTRLARMSLRRDPGLSATIVAVMTVVSGIFSTGLLHYLRFYGPTPAPTPALHHVEVDTAARALLDAFQGTTAAPNAIAARMRVSYPHYLLLAASHIPARETGTFRARLLVRRPAAPPGAVEPAPSSPPPPAEGGATAAAWRCPRNARFVNADFFGMFGLELGAGAPWTRAEEAAHQAVVVISKALGDDLFPAGDALGATLLVNGVPYRIVGICAAHAPTAPPWDPAAAGGSQDVLYLPFAEHERLVVSPEMPIHVSPRGPSTAELLASEEIFVSYWTELPTEESRRAYRVYLERTFGPRRMPVILRDLSAFRAQFAPPPTAVGFFMILTTTILLGGGLIMTRLLLAKGLVRADELGIFRALGAPRRSLFSRQLIEAALLSGAAGVLSTLIAGPQAFFYNRAVADTDIPITITPHSFAITLGATVGVGLLCALYPAWRASTRAPTVALGRH